MAADFQRLDLIPLNQIGNDGEYVRVASVDHPFRGLVAWAYMANAGRPGLPERDLDSWADEVTDQLNAAKSEASPSAAAVGAAPLAAKAEPGIAKTPPPVSDKKTANADADKVAGEDPNAGD
jgi:hypothetical protein